MRSRADAIACCIIWRFVLCVAAITLTFVLLDGCAPSSTSLRTSAPPEGPDIAQEKGWLAFYVKEVNLEPAMVLCASEDFLLELATDCAVDVFAEDTTLGTRSFRWGPDYEYLVRGRIEDEAARVQAWTDGNVSIKNVRVLRAVYIRRTK